MNDEKQVPIRCPENDPHRCQASARGGQCPFLAMPGTIHCPIHGSKEIRASENALYQFNKTEVLARISAFRSHGDSRTLAIELGLLRLLLEQIINKCDGYDLIMNSVQISTLIGQIKELQTANIKLEQRVGDLLSMDQVIEIAQALYTAVTKYVSDVEILGKIAEDFENIASNSLGGSK